MKDDLKELIENAMEDCQQGVEQGSRMMHQNMGALAVLQQIVKASREKIHQRLALGQAREVAVDGTLLELPTCDGCGVARGEGHKRHCPRIRMVQVDDCVDCGKSAFELHTPECKQNKKLRVVGGCSPALREVLESGEVVDAAQ